MRFKNNLSSSIDLKDKKDVAKEYLDVLSYQLLILAASLIMFSGFSSANVTGEVVYSDSSLSDGTMISNMVSDSQGNVYAEYGNRKIIKFNKTGGIKWNYTKDIGEEKINEIGIDENRDLLIVTEGTSAPEGGSGEEDDLHVVNMTTGNQICHLNDMSPGEAAFGLAITDQNIYVGFENYYSNENPGPIYEISFPPDCSQNETLSIQDNSVFGMDSDNDNYIYSAGRDNKVFKFNASGDVEWVYDDADEWLQWVEADPNGDAAFTAESGVNDAGDGLLHKIDENGNNEWKTTAQTDESGNSPNSVIATKNNRLFVALGDDVVREWDYDGDEKWNYTQHTGSVKALAWHKESNTLYSAGGQELHKIKVKGSPPEIVSNNPQGSGIELNSSLEVTVGDSDADDLIIKFYGGKKGSNLEHIETKQATLVDSTDLETLVVEDPGFNSDPGTKYEVRVNVSDGNSETNNVSETWSFETRHAPSINQSSAEPSGGEETNSTLLSVEVNGNASDYIYVNFFVNGSLNGTESITGGSGTASINADLQSNRKYEWYVKAVDQTLSSNNTDNPWKFNTGDLDVTVQINLNKSIENAVNYNIYRRQGNESDNPSFDYGDGDYQFVSSQQGLELEDSSNSLGQGNFCYVVTAENPAGESPASNEECIEVVK
jgi:hypothetical protein